MARQGGGVTRDDHACRAALAIGMIAMRYYRVGSSGCQARPAAAAGIESGPYLPGQAVLPTFQLDFRVEQVLAAVKPRIERVSPIAAESEPALRARRRPGSSSQVSSTTG